MASSLCIPMNYPPSQNQLLHPSLNSNSHRLFLGANVKLGSSGNSNRRFAFTTKALLSPSREAVLKDFHERRALKIISGLQNFDRENVASVVTAADKGGASLVDIACDPELVKLVFGLTSLPICVSSVDPEAFPAAVEAGATMVEIGNYDSFYETGRLFSPDEIQWPKEFAPLGGADTCFIAFLGSDQKTHSYGRYCKNREKSTPLSHDYHGVMLILGSVKIVNLTRETRRILPSVVLSVTVPHTLCLPDQVRLAELLEQEGADIIQTEGGKCSSPSKAGILGLIEKATPTLASAYSISRAVKVPVMCSSGLSAVTAPMAITAGASGVGVGSAVNKLNDVLAMIAEIRSIANSLDVSTLKKKAADKATSASRTN